MQRITVFTIPGVLKNNPYLSLLLEHVSGDQHDGIAVNTTPFSFSGVFKNLFLRNRVSLIHIHWETAIYGSRYWWYSITKIIWRFPALFLARAFGARIVWTMHNLHAHEYPHPFIDALGRSIMWSLAQTAIVQNHDAILSLQKQHPHSRIVYIPHANYTGVYGPRVSKDEARKKLGIANDAHVFLALGAIRPYKQLELLIQTFREIEKTSQKKPTLLIAGKGEAAYIEKLREIAKGSASVRLHPQFVSDDQLPVFLGAADYAVFAHDDSSLTSGAIILALSYGLPVLTKPMPAAEIIQEGVNGFVVPENGLAKAIQHVAAVSSCNPEAVIATVAARTWEQVGKETRAVYALSI